MAISGRYVWYVLCKLIFLVYCGSKLSQNGNVIYVSRSITMVPSPVLCLFLSLTTYCKQANTTYSFAIVNSQLFI